MEASGGRRLSHRMAEMETGRRRDADELGPSDLNRTRHSTLFPSPPSPITRPSPASINPPSLTPSLLSQANHHPTSSTTTTLMSSPRTLSNTIPPSTRHPPTRPSPVRVRLADHLIAAPGVSFARSLSAHSSSCGTIRSSSSIVRSSHPKSTSSNIPHPAIPPPSTHPPTSRPLAPSHLPASSLTPADPSSSPPSAHHHHISSTPSPPPTPSVDPPHPPSSPSSSSASDPPSKVAQSPGTTSAIEPPSMISDALDPPHPSRPPSSAKPKSWADLLRRPLDSNPHPSTSGPPSQSSSPSHLSNGLAPRSANSQFTQNAALPLSAKLNALNHRHPISHLVPRGLVNNGNICFANAILQVLVHCPPFYNLLHHLGQIVPHDFSSKTPLLDAMIGFIHEFQLIDPSQDLQPIRDSDGQLKRYQLPNSASHLHQGDPFIAESVWLATKDNSRFDAMRRGQQEDAQEFLCFFLDSLHEELLLITQRHDSSVRSTKLSERPSNRPPSNLISTRDALNSGEWLEVGAKGQAAITRSMDSSPSPLTELFDLKTRSVLHRSGQKDSVMFEPTNMLQLSIEHPSINTIEQALVQFSSPEVISDMISKSGQRISATKQVYIETLPPVLVLHLKRFHYNSADGTVHKSNKPIQFGSELTIPQLMRTPVQRGSNDGASDQTKYKLFAVVYHHGPHASGGHYTVLIRQPVLDSWIYIDDTQITPITNPDMIFKSLISTGSADSERRKNGINERLNHPTRSSSSSLSSLTSSISRLDPSHPKTGTINGHHRSLNGSTSLGASNHDHHPPVPHQNFKSPYLLFYTRSQP